MTVIAGLNNRGITIIIQICGKNVEIPPGRFVIKKDDDGNFYADRPEGIRYNHVGPDLGPCDIVSNTTTLIAGINSDVNIGQYNNLIDNVVGSTPEMQGLWLSAGIDETFPGWADNERVVGGYNGIKFNGNNDVFLRGNIYLLNCDCMSSFRINIIPNQPGGIVAFTMDDMFNISINNNSLSTSIILNNNLVKADFYENKFISKLIIMLNGLNTVNISPEFSNIIVDGKTYTTIQLFIINDIFAKAWMKGSGNLLFENLKTIIKENQDDINNAFPPL
jgi:hypothetical protein